MSRDYSNYRSFYQPEPSRYYVEPSSRSRQVPPPIPPRDHRSNSSYRQTQQFWRDREDAAPVQERTSHRRYRLEEPTVPRRSSRHSSNISSRDRDRDRDRHSHDTSRHRSVVPSEMFDPAEILFANIFQNLFALHQPFDDDVGMVIVGQSLRFPGVLRAPMGVHIRFYGVFAEPEDEEPVGLDQRAIERIPVLTYRKSSSRRTSDDDKCAVCLSEFQNGDKVKRLKCKHYFHVDCIDPWLKTSTVCPICRGEQK